MNSAPDELANRLDEVLAPHNSGLPDRNEDDPLIDMAVRLARGPHPVLGADAVAKLQARLLASAPRRSKPLYQYRVLQWAAAACLIVVLVVSGTATVSAQSLPGDTLYPVKRLVERGRLALTGDEGEVELRLKYAERRQDEFAELREDRDEINADVLGDASDEMNTAFDLMATGIASEAEYRDKLVALSERQAELAQGALEAADPSEVEELQRVVVEADHLKEKVRSLSRLPRSHRALPDNMYTRHNNLQATPEATGLDTVAVFEETPTVMATANGAAPAYTAPRKPVEDTYPPILPDEPEEPRDEAGDDEPPVVVEPPIVTPEPTDLPPTDEPPAVIEEPVVTPEPTDVPATDEPPIVTPTPTDVPPTDEGGMVDEPEEPRDEAGDDEPPVVVEPPSVTPEPTEVPPTDEPPMVIEEPVVTPEPTDVPQESSEATPAPSVP